MLKIIENLGNTLALLQDNIIRNQWTKANDLQASNTVPSREHSRYKY